MTNELQQRIYDRWPKWFRPDGSIQETLIPFGLEVDDGWFQIVWDLCEAIEKVLGSAEFQVVQVKEKFAGLRFYTEGGGDAYVAINQLISRAEDLSVRTCEVCGKPGETRGGSWLKTTCEEHAGGKRAVGPIECVEDLIKAVKPEDSQE